MIPGFKQFLWVRSRGVPGRSRVFWNEVAGLHLDDRERSIIDRVEAVRKTLEADTRKFRRVDFGVGSTQIPMTSARTTSVGVLARKASVSPSWGRLLFKIARAARSSRILELGTCTGLSAAYLQAALDLNDGGLLVTIEGDPFLSAVARETLGAVSREPGTVIEGSFAEVLPAALASSGPFDLVFIDGHHNPAAVEAYFNTIAPHLVEGGVVIIDDIQPLTGAVRSAWRTIRTRSGHRWTVDLLRMGIVRRH